MLEHQGMFSRFNWHFFDHVEHLLHFGSTVDQTEGMNIYFLFHLKYFKLREERKDMILQYKMMWSIKLYLYYNDFIQFEYCIYKVMWIKFRSLVPAEGV